MGKKICKTLTPEYPDYDSEVHSTYQKFKFNRRLKKSEIDEINKRTLPKVDNLYVSYKEWKKTKKISFNEYLYEFKNPWVAKNSSLELFGSNEEKQRFYEWLYYLIEYVFKKHGLLLNGEFKWTMSSDCGNQEEYYMIKVKDNKIKTYKTKNVYHEQD